MKRNETQTQRKILRRRRCNEMEMITMKYTIQNRQLIWEGKTHKSPFAGVMCNTPEELLRFGKEQFPGCEIKVEEMYSNIRYSR